MPAVSVVIPAYNEAGAVGDTVRQVHAAFEGAGLPFEIIVVNDGSRDETGRAAREAGATVVRHPQNIGYGNAIMSGVRHARHPLIALTDADGTYPVEELPSMAEEVDRRGLDMLVGARRGRQYTGRLGMRLSRLVFKWLGEFTVGQRIPDINSGLRVMRRDMVMKFAPVACGGFSFSTTTTLIALLTGHFVSYRPIDYHARTGESKVRYVRDTLRAGQVLVMTILLFNPIKLYILLAAGVLAAGVLLGGLALLLPALATVISIFGAFLLAASILMGLGFLAEQRRADSRGRTRMTRSLALDEHGPPEPPAVEVPRPRRPVEL